MSRSNSKISFSEDDESDIGDVDVSSLQGKKVEEYSIQDVSTWLTAIGLGSKAPAFVGEMISGEELVSLTRDDLRELGIASLGHRKKFAAKLKKWQKVGAAAMDMSSHSESSQSSAHAQPMTFRAKYKKKKHMFKGTTATTLDELVKEFSTTFGQKVKLRVYDEDEDLVPIKNDSELQYHMEDADEVEFQCVRDTATKKGKAGKGGAASTAKAAGKKNAAAAVAAEYAMLDGMVDANVVINEDGEILFFNKAAEALWGAARKDVLGQNVKCLMPDTYARKHDGYLAKYMSTGVKRVIGKKRKVMAKKWDGNMIAVTLAITEVESAAGSRFMAVVTPTEETTGDKFGALDALQEAAIVIDETGTMLAFNTAAQKLFGYSKEDAVGQGVEMLMPNPHKDNHNFYLSRYLSTGVKKVVGTSRDVLCELADGSLQKVNLALSEQIVNGEHQFTGLLRPIKEMQNKSSTAKKDTVMKMARRLVAAVDIAGVVIDSRGTVQAFNPAAERFFGYKLVEVVGHNVKMLMNDDDAGKHDSYMEAYHTTGQAKVIGKDRVVKAKLKNGSLKEVMLSVTETEDETGKKIYTGLMHPKDTKRTTK